MYLEILLSGQILHYPVLPFTNAIAVVSQQNTNSKGDLTAMLTALGVRETGITTGNDKQYQFVHPELGFLGKYQFAEILLIRLGYYQAKVYFGNGADKNYWRGLWTGKRGINSKSQFLNSSQVQEIAIREAFSVYYQDINYLLKNKGKSLNNYLGKKINTTVKGKPKSMTITLSGVLAGAHLKGPDQLVKFLITGKVSQDPFGTTISEYVDEFGGYNIQLKDFFIPGV